MTAFRKILYVTDLSPASEPALAYAADLARAFGGEVHAVHVLVLGADDPVEAERRLAELVPEEQADVVTERRLVKAHHADVGVVHEADAGHYDLVVLGTHGHSGLSHVLLGSVAERVVQHARCPVLTVRPPDFSYAAL